MRTQLIDDARDAIGVDARNRGEVVRREERADSRGVFHEHFVDQLLVYRVHMIQKVGEAVRALEIECDADIPELQVEVDEGDRGLPAASCERHREVCRDRGAADATLRAVHGDDCARPRRRSGNSFDPLQAAELLEVHVGIADRAHEVLRLIGLQEEAASTGGHRA